MLCVLCSERWWIAINAPAADQNHQLSFIFSMHPSIKSFISEVFLKPDFRDGGKTRAIQLDLRLIVAKSHEQNMN